MSSSYAKKIHEIKYIYACYGFFDGLTTSYSMFKYYFDVFFSDSDSSSSNMMHDWMSTSVGGCAAGSITVFIVGFSFFANVFDDNDKEAYKRYIAIAWPYVRDSMKGLKNTYKGVRSTLQAVSMMSGHDMQNMLVPTGLALGAISILNRLCMRYFVKEPRLAMTKVNAQILQEIKGTCFYTLENPPAEPEIKIYKNSYIWVKDELLYISHLGVVEKVKISSLEGFKENLKILNPDAKEKFYLAYEEVKSLVTENGGHIPLLGGLDKEDCEGILTQLNAQSEQLNDRLNRWALLGAAYGGIVDGLYLYMGALGLVALSPPVFIAMTVCSSLFALANVTTRIFEEYEFQRKFVSTQAKIKLALSCKELEAIWGTLQRISDPTNHFPEILPESELQRLFERVDNPSDHDFPNVDMDDGIVVNREELREQSRRLLEDLRALSQRLEQLSEPTLQREDAAGQHAEKRKTLIENLQKLYKYELISKKREIDGKRKDLRALGTFTKSLAFFAGVRHGLAFYSAITSLMFATAIFIDLPATFLIAGVMLGMVFLVGCIIHSFFGLPQESYQKEEVVESHSLQSLMVEIKNPQKQIQDIPSINVKEAVHEAMSVDAAPRYYIQECCEVVRSFGSGWTKGPKLLEFVQAMWQSWTSFPDDGDHHDQETPVLFRVAAACALIQAVVFALRAVGRGLGRDDPDAAKPPKTLRFFQPRGQENNNDLNNHPADVPAPSFAPT